MKLQPTTQDMIARLVEHGKTFPSPLFEAAAGWMRDLDIALAKEKAAYAASQEQYYRLDKIAGSMQWLLNAATKEDQEWQDSRTRLLEEYQKAR